MTISVDMEDNPPVKGEIIKVDKKSFIILNEPKHVKGYNTSDDYEVVVEEDRHVKN